MGLFYELLGFTVICLTLTDRAEAFSSYRSNHHESLQKHYSQSQMCRGSIPAGDHCGAVPHLCCQNTQCQAYNLFFRKFIPCPSGSDHQDCTCMHDIGAEEPPREQYISSDWCGGKIEAGGWCGKTWSGCCGSLRCATRTGRSCPRWAAPHQCICMATTATPWGHRII